MAVFARQCFEDLADLPAVETAGGLGGTLYFVLIVASQLVGVLVEVILFFNLIFFAPPNTRCHRCIFLFNPPKATPRYPLIWISTKTIISTTKGQSDVAAAQAAAADEG